MYVAPIFDNKELRHFAHEKNINLLISWDDTRK